MPPADSSSGKYNIQIGTVSESQVAIGDYNTVTQRVGFSPEDVAQLRSLFADFKSSIAIQAPPETRAEALLQADDLERAIVADQPDPGKVGQVLRWFRDHVPELAGTAVSVVVNPLVGKLIEGAGQAIADHFRQVVDEEL